MDFFLYQERKKERKKNVGPCKWDPYFNFLAKKKDNTGELIFFVISAAFAYLLSLLIFLFLFYRGQKICINGLYAHCVEIMSLPHVETRKPRKVNTHLNRREPRKSIAVRF